jgi:hypothetical protein
MHGHIDHVLEDGNSRISDVWFLGQASDSTNSSHITEKSVALEDTDNNLCINTA